MIRVMKEPVSNHKICTKTEAFVYSVPGGSIVAPKEVAGKLLAHAKCVELLGQGVWKTFATNIESGDLAGAITALGTEGRWQAMILRALTYFKDAEGSRDCSRISGTDQISSLGHLDIIKIICRRWHSRKRSNSAHRIIQ